MTKNKIAFMVHDNPKKATAAILFHKTEQGTDISGLYL